ncbi:MAG: hypothetical protein ACJ741_19600 [Pyrinomonadaceae bacterium]
MPKKILSLVLSVLVINLCGVGRVHAATRGVAGDAATADGGAGGQKPVDPKKVEKVKRQIAVIGATSKEVIAVKLRDKDVKGGYVSEIADDHFTLIDEHGPVTISYADVKGIRRTHMSTKTMNIVGIVAIGVLAMLVVAAIGSRGE